MCIGFQPLDVAKMLHVLLFVEEKIIDKTKAFTSMFSVFFEIVIVKKNLLLFYLKFHNHILGRNFRKHVLTATDCSPCKIFVVQYFFVFIGSLDP